MPQNPSDKLRECIVRIHDLRQRALSEKDRVSKAELHALELQWREAADSYKVVEASRRYLNDVRSRRSNGLQIESVLDPENTRTAEPQLPAGTSIADLLEVLVRATVEYTQAEARAAFYLANTDRQTLHHVTGMPVDYARHVDGFVIGQSLWPAAYALR
jgi:hypothetical protein